MDPMPAGPKRSTAAPYPVAQRSNNLPAPVSSFIGRERELGVLRRLLERNRLVTLTGPGGIGKSRLALAAVTEVDTYEDGVWLVELADLAGSGLVPDRIIKTLGLYETPETSPLERLTDGLQQSRLLLVLDNCEHLLAECASVAAHVLSRCPGLTVLATSRESLRIEGETVVPVPVLDVPDRTGTVSAAMGFDAVRLFVERAQAAAPSFALTASNLPAVAEVCARLDGLPLALELAAARLRALTLGELTNRLDERLRLLTGGDRTAPLRQQTLRATIEWSYRLLAANEQHALQRLSVFAGDFTLVAAQEVVAGPVPTSDTLEDLVRLVDHSLVQFDPARGRYRLLESIRLFSGDQLEQAGAGETARERHLHWFRRVAEDAAARLTGSEQAAAAAVLELEHDNLRAALAWAIRTHRVDEAARLALSLWRFWHTHGYLREGRHWLTQIRELDAETPQPPELRPVLLFALGVLENSLTCFDEAQAGQHAALRLWRDLGDRGGMAQALCALGWQQFDQMRQDRARSYAEESLVLAREVGDPRAVAQAQFLRALALVETGSTDGQPPRPSKADLAEAVVALEEGLAIWRSTGDIGQTAQTMSLLARVEAVCGDRRRASQLLRDAVRLLVDVGNSIDLQAALVALMMMAVTSTEQPAGVRDAAQVAGVIMARFETLGGSSPWIKGPMRVQLAQFEAELGPVAFAEVFDRGRHLQPHGLVELAEHITEVETGGPPEPQPQPAALDLTPREREVLRSVAAGLSNAEVAERLYITSRTVNAHLTAIYRKLGVTSRGGAMRYAFDHRLD